MSRQPFGERSITVPPHKFLAGELTPADVLPLMTDDHEGISLARSFAEHLDDYDLIEWACELVGFERQEVGAVQAWFDEPNGYIIIQVALMDEWVPEYVVPIMELVDGRAPIPRRRNEQLRRSNA